MNEKEKRRRKDERLVLGEYVDWFYAASDLVKDSIPKAILVGAVLITKNKQEQRSWPQLNKS